MVLSFLPVSLNVLAQSETPYVITSIAWSPDGTQIAVGRGIKGDCQPNSDMVDVQIIDANFRQVIQELSGSHCQITSVDWNTEGTKLVAGSLEGVGTRVWDIQTGQLVMVANEGGQGVSSVKWQPHGSQIAVADAYSNGISIVDALSGETISSAPIGGYSIDWSPDGTLLASGGDVDFQIHIADVSRAREISPLSGHDAPIRDVDWSPDGTKLASTSNDDTVRLWDAASWKLLDNLDIADIVNLRWSPDSQKLAVARYDGLMQVWDASTGQLLQSYDYQGHVWAVDWSPNGNQLAYGGDSDIDQLPDIEIVSAPETPTPPSRSLFDKLTAGK